MPVQPSLVLTINIWEPDGELGGELITGNLARPGQAKKMLDIDLARRNMIVKLLAYYGETKLGEPIPLDSSIELILGEPVENKP